MEVFAANELLCLQRLPCGFVVKFVIAERRVGEGVASVRGDGGDGDGEGGGNGQEDGQLGRQPPATPPACPHLTVGPLHLPTVTSMRG